MPNFTNSNSAMCPTAYSITGMPSFMTYDINAHEL